MFLDEIAKHIKVVGETSSNGEDGYVHTHMYQINNDGNGKTVSIASVDGNEKREHVHDIKNFYIKKSDEDKHRHYLQLLDKE